MALADFDPRMIRRDECAGNAVIFFAGIAQQAVWVLQFEGQAHNSGDRREGNPALVKGEPQAHHLFALVNTLTDDAHIRN